MPKKVTHRCTHQDQQAGDHSQHHHNDDGDDPTGQVLHGNSGGFLVHVVHQDALHLQLLVTNSWLKLVLVLEQGQHLYLQDKDDKISQRTTL